MHSITKTHSQLPGQIKKAFRLCEINVIITWRDWLVCCPPAQVISIALGRGQAHRWALIQPCPHKAGMSSQWRGTAIEVLQNQHLNMLGLLKYCWYLSYLHTCARTSRQIFFWPQCYSICRATLFTYCDCVIITWEAALVHCLFLFRLSSISRRRSSVW